MARSETSFFAEGPMYLPSRSDIAILNITILNPLETTIMFVALLLLGILVLFFVSELKAWHGRRRTGRAKRKSDLAAVLAV